MTDIIKNCKIQTPGEKLFERMEKIPISGNALASLMNVPSNRITDIIRGRRKITPDTSIRLALVFRNFFYDEDDYWFNLQNQYDMAIELETKKEITALLRPIERII